MKWLTRAAVALTVGFLATAALVVGTLIWMMFGSSGEPGRSTALFGALFYEERDRAGGGVTFGMGVTDYGVLLAVFLVISLAVFAVTIVYGALRGYRAGLIESGVDPG